MAKQRKGPFEDLAAQAAELLVQLDEGLKKGQLSIPAGAEDFLDQMKTVVDTFGRLTEESVPGTVDYKPQQASSRDRGTIEQLERLEREFRMRETLLRMVMEGKRMTPSTTDSPKVETEAAKERKKNRDLKKKFKRMGGDQNWLPM